MKLSIVFGFFLIGSFVLALGSTLLLLSAARSGDVTACTTLLAEGVNPNIVVDNSTALVAAAETNQTMIVDLLLKHGADPNIREPVYNETSLFKASFKGYISLAKLLINAGADVKLTIKNEETCLMWASFRGHFEIVQLLVDNGADINAQDTKYGFSPLLVASRNGYVDIVRFLIAKGANLLLVDKSGNNAAALASLKGHQEVERIILLALAQHQKGLGQEDL